MNRGILMRAFQIEIRKKCFFFSKSFLSKTICWMLANQCSLKFLQCELSEKYRAYFVFSLASIFLTFQLLVMKCWGKRNFLLVFRSCFSQRIPFVLQLPGAFTLFRMCTETEMDLFSPSTLNCDLLIRKLAWWRTCAKAGMPRSFVVFQLSCFDLFFFQNLIIIFAIGRIATLDCIIWILIGRNDFQQLLYRVKFGKNGNFASRMINLSMAILTWIVSVCEAGFCSLYNFLNCWKVLFSLQLNFLGMPFFHHWKKPCLRTRSS